MRRLWDLQRMTSGRLIHGRTREITMDLVQINPGSKKGAYTLTSIFLHKLAPVTLELSSIAPANTAWFVWKWTFICTATQLIRGTETLVGITPAKYAHALKLVPLTTVWAVAAWCLSTLGETRLQSILETTMILENLWKVEGSKLTSLVQNTKSCLSAGCRLALPVSYLLAPISRTHYFSKSNDVFRSWYLLKWSIMPYHIKKFRQSTIYGEFKNTLNRFPRIYFSAL